MTKNDSFERHGTVFRNTSLYPAISRPLLTEHAYCGIDSSIPCSDR